MKCIAGSECQGASSGPDDIPAVCSVHGKKRSGAVLMDDGAGGKRCTPGNECKDTGAVPDKKRSDCKWCRQGECWTHQMSGFGGKGGRFGPY